ncbi:MAG TPA: flavin reductase family protein [Miltoncostaeales bacterium]|nr:flavin reductase family protein [Miltoncostaeales bacterium]
MADLLSVSPDDFKATLARWASGVTVVTAAGPVGMTVSAFSSLSLEPPLVTVALSTDAHSSAPILAAEGFAVHILGDDQRALSTRFASPVDRFADLTWHDGPFGTPLLPACLARLVCAHHAVADGGDHQILIGRVVQVDVGEGEPVLYYRGAYRELASSDG